MLTRSEISAILKMQSEITDKHQDTKPPTKAAQYRPPGQTGRDRVNRQEQRIRAQQGAGTLHQAQPGGGTLQQKTDQPRNPKRKRETRNNQDRPQAGREKT